MKFEDNFLNLPEDFKFDLPPDKVTVCYHKVINTLKIGNIILRD